MYCRAFNRRRARRSRAGFTLAEVLAAMLFMAIVIPVAVAALRVASLAGEVSMRKDVAARIAERVLNETVVTGQTLKSTQSGTIREGQIDYRWAMKLDPSSLENMRLATVQVTFAAQGKDYDVTLSTLLDATQ